MSAVASRPHSVRTVEDLPREATAAKRALRAHRNYISCSYYELTNQLRSVKLNVEKYLLISLDETVVFPGMTVTMPLDTADESRVLLVPRHNGEYAKVGTVAGVIETGRLPGGAQIATLSGQTRALLGAAETSAGGRLYIEVEEHSDETPPPVKTRELESEYRAVVEEILELRDADARVGEFLRSIAEPGALADTCAYSPDLTFRAARRAARDA